MSRRAPCGYHGSVISCPDVTTVTTKRAQRPAGPAIDPGLLIEIWAAAQYVDLLVQEAMAAAGSTGERLATLARIGQGPITLSELAAAMGQPFMTVSDAVRQLAAWGEVAITPHPSDGRSKLISVTAAGRARLRQSAEPLLAVGRAIDEALESDPRAIRASLLDLRRALESVYDAQQGLS
jgi:DNA-binding MarR family transcriptional regulator